MPETDAQAADAGLMTEAEWARRAREESLVRGRGYQRYPVGQEVGNFLRSLTVSRRSRSTIMNYELVLRRFALDHRDLTSLEDFCGGPGADLIYAFLERYWGEASHSTMHQRVGILKSFFAWAYAVEKVSRDPMKAISRPRKDEAFRRAHELAEIRRIAFAQPNPRDEAAILLLGRLGLRKNDLRELQLGDIDLERDVIFIRRGKGGKAAELPIAFADVRDALRRHLELRQGRSDEYLLYARSRRHLPMCKTSVHRWFKRCLKVADAPPFPMHELRHSAGDYIWRETGDLVLAQQLLRHSSIETTRRYLHPTSDDLASAMRALNGDG